MTTLDAIGKKLTGDLPENSNNLTSERRGLCSISDSIAAMFLKNAIEKGYGLEIPSLGIKIEGTKK